MPSKLTPWTLPDSYSGATWEGYLIAPVGRNRDSDLLTESNWNEQIKTLHGLSTQTVNDLTAYEIVREGHWACGWIEWVAIRPDAAEVIAAMETLAARLENYPVLNEDDWSMREHESACESFDKYTVRELAKGLAETFELKPRTVERWNDIDPAKVLSFMLDKVGTVETIAEGGGATFVWEDFGRAPVTRNDLAAFLWANRREAQS